MSILALLIIGILYIYKYNKRINDDNLYGLPSIALVTMSDENITIKAGMYHYGDINQDEIINRRDLEFIKLLIDSKQVFTDDQKKLADYDKNGIVNETDIESVRKYLNNREEVKYNAESYRLLYCISKKANYNNCEWQDSNEFILDGGTDYYAFVTLRNNLNVVSNYYKITLMKKDKTMEHSEPIFSGVVSE